MRGNIVCVRQVRLNHWDVASCVRRVCFVASAPWSKVLFISPPTKCTRTYLSRIGGGGSPREQQGCVPGRAPLSGTPSHNRMWRLQSALSPPSPVELCHARASTTRSVIVRHPCPGDITLPIPKARSFFCAVRHLPITQLVDARCTSLPQG